MVHGKNRIPYRIDRSLTGLAGPDYAATISFGLPFELGDCQYGESRPTYQTYYLPDLLPVTTISALISSIVIGHLQIRR